MNADLQYLLAEQLLQANHLEAAQQLCEAWTNDVPDCWQAWHALGKLQSRLADPAAEHSFHQALSLAEPGHHGPIQYDIGHWLKTQGAYTAAALAWYNAAIAELNIQHVDTALAWLRAARDISPADEPTLRLLAHNLRAAATSRHALADWLTAEADRIESQARSLG